MKSSPPTDSDFLVLDEPEVCEECHSGSRLSNGLCLQCLFRGVLENEIPSGREAFKEALAAVKSGDGDWRIADHEILDEIARGGMGVIYRAREPHSDRIVALKCVLAYQGDSDQALARFRREAETMARLDHPNIVPIYQIGETADGFPFFTMKYATGGSLLQTRGSALRGPRASVLLMSRVARAVQYAHEQGVLHRDLKPGNILLDGRGEPLVGDFGLARCEETASQLTRSLASFGTPGYIAPEQADGPAAQLKPAADIYSLGAMLFELLTGRPPFVGDNAFAVMKQTAEKPAPKLCTLAPHLDRDLQTICERCLEREPADRYQSAASLAGDLQNWLDDRPIVARPAGIWLQSRRWIRHNRRLAALLVAFCLVGAGSLLWQIRSQRIQSGMHENVLAARSIAILPFYDLDTALVDRRVTQAFATSLRNGLKPLGPAPVTVLEPEFAVSRDRFGDLSKAGQQNRSRSVIMGTVRTVQGRQRISFQLIEPASKETLFTHLWEGKRESGVASALGKEVTQAMYEILSANDWSPLIQANWDPGLRNADAREAMTAARSTSHSSLADFDKAIRLFERALVLEPDSALAHAYLAMEYTARTHFSPDVSLLELAKKEAERALQLSPKSVEAHQALASIHYQAGRFSEALEQALQTLELGGARDRLAMLLGMTLDMLGRPHEALGWHELAARLSQNPGEADESIGDCWTKLADDEQAERAYRRAIELQRDPSDGIIGLARLRLLQGDVDEAREICRSLPVARGELGAIAAQIEFYARRFNAALELYRDLHKVNPTGGGSFYGAMTYCSAAGRALQALGETSEAKRALEDCLIKERANAEREPQDAEAVYRLAAAEASLGMTEAALSHLRKSVTLGWVDYRSLNLDPRFDSLRGPEFQTIIDELSTRVAEMRGKANDTRK